jgi:hypothetical protein
MNCSAEIVGVRSGRESRRREEKRLKADLFKSVCMYSMNTDLPPPLYSEGIRMCSFAHVISFSSLLFVSFLFYSL